MDCSPPGSSVHGILQARIQEWVAMPSSRVSSWPGIRPRSPKELQADSLPFEPPGKPDVSRLAGPNFGSNIRRWIREGEGRFRSDLEVHWTDMVSWWGNKRCLKWQKMGFWLGLMLMGEAERRKVKTGTSIWTCWIWDAQELTLRAPVG